MIRINQLKLPITHSESDLKKKAAKMLRISESQIKELEIIRQSLDARHKNDLLYVYTIDIAASQESKIVKKVNNNNIMLINPKKYQFPASGDKIMMHRPVIIGFGPAGLFCGYMLAKAGYKPLILERGEAVEERQKTVDVFWKNGILNPKSNVQFGEGGAGTFSDGKLNTLVKDKDGRGHEVMKIFVENGAPKEILYQQKPHLGTDVLIDIVRNMRNKIIAWGGEVRFNTQVTDITLETESDHIEKAAVTSHNNEAITSNHLSESKRIVSVTVNNEEIIPTDVVVLAPGHSARDTFFMLYEKGVPMEPKSFAVGVRIEHPQTMINLSQYGHESIPQLGAASYKLTHQTETQTNHEGNQQKSRGVFSFCMCPGGYVVNASSEEGFLAVNGMSYQARDGKNANSALIVTVNPDDYKPYGDLLNTKHKDSKDVEERHLNDYYPEALYGIAFQRYLEEKAYEAGQGRIPVQLFRDFCENKTSTTFGEITPCMKGAYQLSNVRGIFPTFLGDALEEGIHAFGKKIRGYDREDAILSGVESRSSSPIRITRDESYQSQIKGFYPCGEGAGYAGGITSAAMDGIKVSECIAKKYMNLA